MLVIKPENVGLQVVDSIEVTYSSRTKFSLAKCVKNTFHFLFSQVGLCALVVLYAFIGGFVFRHLEQTNEVHECREKISRYHAIENETLESLWAIASNVKEKEAADREFRDQLRSFRSFVSQQDVDSENTDECNKKFDEGDWTFADALLFAVTVFTTIGYGNVAPRTFWGRLVCICYAMLGIPLMLLCLGNLATVLGDAFRYVYSQLLCCGCCVPRRRNEATENGNGPDRPNVEPRKSIMNLQVTLSPEQWMRSYEAVTAHARKPPEASQPDEAISEDHNITPDKISTEPRFQQNENSNGKTEITTTKQNDDDDDDNEDDDYDDSDRDEKVSIPLTVSLGLIAGYLIFGAALFCLWEKDWDYLAAAYYCFVTISTIGFGDLVPGSAAFHTDGDGWRMVVASLYMLIGMALLSMCFNLIQDEIASKCRRLGQLIGLIDK